MSSFVTYRTFTDPEEASALVQVLDHHKIPYRIDTARPPVDMSFDPDRTQERILIFVPQGCVVDADRAQETAVPSELDFDVGGHHFQDFSDEELLDVLYKSHEWNPADVLIARRLLADRGVEVSAEAIEEKKEQLAESMRQPVKGPFFLMAAGYLLSLLGGILGIALGWSFATMKERDPSGREFYKYDEGTRRDGRWMMGIGFVSALFWLFR